MLVLLVYFPIMLLAAVVAAGVSYVIGHATQRLWIMYATFPLLWIALVWMTPKLIRALL